MSLLIDNVSYRYPKALTPAVDQVNCHFESGKLYAIMGPSGSGKSTFLSMMAGLDQPTEGHIRLGQQSLRELNLDTYRRDHIAMIFQAFHLLPLLTVIENVCYPMELKGVTLKDARLKAEALLQNVGISSEKMKRFPSKLSGGEQQRVAIARSLASGANILLADEPTGNLDAINTDLIMTILKSLSAERDYCVIVVTHDASVAEFADKVFTMKDGRLLDTTAIIDIDYQ